MEIVNIHEAKTHLSRLPEQFRPGKPFVIANGGRPIAKVVAVEAPEPGEARRLGFLAGKIEIPDDFDRPGKDEIARVFGVGDDPAP